jgi:polyisoprenoid-binding protein YceI
MQTKYLETQKFPKAKLKSFTLKKTQFEAEIEAHGKTQKVKGQAQVKGRALVGKFKCLISGFGIQSAKYMGVGVEDEIEITVGLPIIQAKAQTHTQKKKGPSR